MAYSPSSNYRFVFRDINFEGISLMREKIKIQFNPDTMTVSDLKQCANALKQILRANNSHKHNDTARDNEILYNVWSIAEFYEVD